MWGLSVITDKLLITAFTARQSGIHIAKKVINDEARSESPSHLFFFFNLKCFTAISHSQCTDTKVALGTWPLKEEVRGDIKHLKSPKSRNILFKVNLVHSSLSLLSTLSSYIHSSGGGQSGWISGAFLHSTRLCFIHCMRPDLAELLF